MSKRFIITIVTLVIIAIAAGAAIFFAKGYTFSTKEKRIVGTGIITITSQPDSASVFIDGHLTTATNATISSLAPKDYSIKVVKEGFIPWEKQVSVKEGLVSELKITLFPAIPTIYPLTFNGVSNPVLSPDETKFAYIVAGANLTGSAAKKAGVWIWTMSNNQPIAFTRSSEPHQIATNSIADFSKAALRWSADSKQILATVGENNYLLDADKLNENPKDITPMLSATLKSWEDDKKVKDELSIQSIKDAKFKKIASDSAFLRWSPDATRFMARLPDGQAKKDTSLDIRVYDLDEGKDYLLPSAKFYNWLPDSKHIILIEEKSISLVDFDGSNKAVIYAGSFLDDFVVPWPDSSRLVIVSSFPTPTASEPNLYGINLR
ncbi:hypothetical protein A3C26_03570 [Candidatus Daviesbacteria bacterium RIFCSPHIGHO2_02_FULL_39_12]|uniref:PEGA domain-containing protein n=2 Tax=Candidatus Daviesiibacteriota TaxID=1752718 RepID=A0A1F5JAD6_9BACT|nr:MAG: hypothetical protein A3C26_03570 [Candidatus Daviesbacteria bacterium RIFCSPHIGHO2_02_FULL_39_12]OGE72820.1 MAG: hypothetical protein A3H40_02020 [Candidatus Daviesbacteria bacterium RIFCSPLOWO2_02_FULL_38_15]